MDFAVVGVRRKMVVSEGLRVRFKKWRGGREEKERERERGKEKAGERERKEEKEREGKKTIKGD